MKKFFSLFIFILSIMCCTKQQIEYQVSYRISCTDCFVVWEENGVQKYASNQNTSWGVDFIGQKDSIVLLMARNSSGVYQSVGATILVDGDTIQHLVSYCPISGTVVLIDTLD